MFKGIESWRVQNTGSLLAVLHHPAVFTDTSSAGVTENWLVDSYETAVDATLLFNKPCELIVSLVNGELSDLQLAS